MATGTHLKIKSMGENVLGVKLEGNPQKPEPIHFRVVLPFGDVDITRTTDNNYWVHIRTNHQDSSAFIPGEDQIGKFIKARIDLTSKPTSEVNIGDFGNPNMYHMAALIGPKG